MAIFLVSDDLKVFDSATLDSPRRRIVFSTGACRFFIGSEMEKSIVTDLASRSTPWFSTALHFARNDDS